MAQQSRTADESRTASQPGVEPPRVPRRSAAPATTTTGSLLVKIILLGLVLAIAIYSAVPLINQRAWLGLVLLVAITALLFWIYLSPKRIPAKYLIPGTLFLVAFQVLPVLYTMTTAFTNFGDGHRGSKEQAIQASRALRSRRFLGRPRTSSASPPRATLTRATSSSSSSTPKPSSPQSAPPTASSRSLPRR